MNVEILEPCGAIVTGMTVNEISPETVDELRLLLADHGVVIVAGQRVDDAVFVSFLAAFGELTFTRAPRAPPNIPSSVTIRSPAVPTLPVHRNAV